MRDLEKEGISMRSFTRAVVVGTVTLPLALAGAGLASAGTGDSHHKHHHHKPAIWVWKFEANALNAGGIVNVNSHNG